MVKRAKFRSVRQAPSPHAVHLAATDARITPEQIVAIERDNVAPPAMAEPGVARGGRSTIFLVMEDRNPRRLPLLDVFEESQALGVVAAVIDDDDLHSAWVCRLTPAMVSSTSAFGL